MDLVYSSDGLFKRLLLNPLHPTLSSLNEASRRVNGSFFSSLSFQEQVDAAINTCRRSLLQEGVQTRLLSGPFIACMFHDH